MDETKNFWFLRFSMPKSVKDGQGKSMFYHLLDDTCHLGVGSALSNGALAAAF